MTITQGRSSKYWVDQSSVAELIGNPVRIGQENCVCFQVLLGADNTTAGTLYLEGGIARDDNVGPNFTPLAWTPIYSVAIAAGLFPNALKSYLLPENVSVLKPWTAVEGVRLRFVPSGGGDVAQINAVCFNKSFG